MQKGAQVAVRLRLSLKFGRKCAGLHLLGLALALSLSSKAFLLYASLLDVGLDTIQVCLSVQLSVCQVLLWDQHCCTVDVLLQHLLNQLLVGFAKVFLLLGLLLLQILQTGVFGGVHLFANGVFAVGLVILFVEARVVVALDALVGHVGAGGVDDLLVGVAELFVLDADLVVVLAVDFREAGAGGAEAAHSLAGHGAAD